MTYEPKPILPTQKALPSSHIINCRRCANKATEGGVIEAHTVYGVGFFALCKQCAKDVLSFISKGIQVKYEDDPDFGVLALLDDRDVDIAEHHPTCECEECSVDGDAHRKFLLENDHTFFEQIYKSA